MPQFIPKFPLDLSGESKHNKVSGETHKLKGRLRFKTLVPNHGAYYTDSLIVRDVKTGEKLKAEQQFLAIQYYEQPSKRSGKEVCASILILERDIDEVEIEYQAVGGEFEAIVPVIERALESVEDFRLQTASWGDLLDKPDVFPPAPHLHRISDVYGFEHVVQSLERMREVLLYRDIAAREITDNPDEIADGTIEPRHLNRDKSFAFPQSISVTTIESEVGDYIGLEAEVFEMGKRLATRDWVIDQYGESEDINFTDWNEAYRSTIKSIQGDGNATLTLKTRDADDITTDLSHSHTVDDLPFSQDQIDGWDKAKEISIEDFDIFDLDNGRLDFTLKRHDGSTLVASVNHNHYGELLDVTGGGNELVTFEREGSNLELDFSHNHDDRYSKTEDLSAIAFSGDYDDINNAPDLDQINDAYNRSVVGLSGDGNGILTVERYNSEDIEHDLSHDHDGEVTAVEGDGNSTLTVFRVGSNLTVDLSHNHGDEYAYREDLTDVAFSGSYNDLKDRPDIDSEVVEDAYNSNITSVSGSGNDRLTLTRRDDRTISTDLSHTHDIDDLPEDAVSRWDQAHDRSLVEIEGSGNGTLTLTREDGRSYTGDLSHTHDFDDLPITSDETLKWSTGYDRSVDGFEIEIGDEKTYLKIHRTNEDTVELDVTALHNRDIVDVEAHGNETLTLYRFDGQTYEVDLSHNHQGEGDDSVKIGYNDTRARDEKSVAIGNDVDVRGYASVSIGENNYIDAQRSMALGYGLEVTEDHSFSFGGEGYKLKFHGDSVNIDGSLNVEGMTQFESPVDVRANLTERGSRVATREWIEDRVGQDRGFSIAMSMIL